MDFGVVLGRSRRTGVAPSVLQLMLTGASLFVLSTALATLGRAQDDRIALAQFTTAIEDREPIDQVTFVQNDVRIVFFYSDLRDLAGQTVNHRWLHDGTVRAEVSFKVRGPRWRVWSSKKLLPDWIGDWTVEIVTANGEVIAAETFTYRPPDA